MEDTNQDDLFQRFIASNEELTRMNDDYKAEPDSRASRRRLATRHRRWQIERDKLIQEWRAAKNGHPTAPA